MQVHCPNLAAIPGAKTVAYCDLDEAKAQVLLKGARRRVRDPGRRPHPQRSAIDAVLIQGRPGAHHPRPVQAAARAGKHIFVEKPISIELADALETLRAVESSGVKFIYGTCNRLAPMVRLAQRMCPAPLYSYCQCADTVTHQACDNLDLAVNLFHPAPLEAGLCQRSAVLGPWIRTFPPTAFPRS